MNKNTPDIAACTFKLNSAKPNEIQLFPAGTFRAEDGRPKGIAQGWVMNATNAQRLIALTFKRKNPYVIDYEHQTLYSEFNGKPAPKSGNFHSLEWRENDGLYAIDVVWTANAKQYIDNKEYDYISPVFGYDKAGNVTSLLHAALTNDPAIDGMSQVAAARYNINHPTQENAMNKILLALGLTVTQTEDEAVAAIKLLLEKVTTLEASATSHADAIAAAKSTAVDPAKFAPMSLVTELQGEVAALKKQGAGDEMGNMIAAAKASGKLSTPAKLAFAESLKAAENKQSLADFIDADTPIAALKNMQTAGKELPDDNSQSTTLTDDQIAVCKATGVSQDEFLKTIKGEK